MSNSATSAAKRRRAGPLLSSPLFQPPQSFQSNKPVIDNTMNFQPEKIINNQPVTSEPPAVDNKFMTIQQVINLITTRLISVENFVNEFGDKPRNEIRTASTESVNIDYSKISEMCKSLIEEHIAEFDHRYEILAEEISNLKNITLNLQSYTMEVNKSLMEERLPKKKIEKIDVKGEDIPNIEFQFEAEQDAEEAVAEEAIVEESVAKEAVAEEAVAEEAVAEEAVAEEAVVEEDPFSINIVSKKDKRGNKKSTIEKSEQELIL